MASSSSVILAKLLKQPKVMFPKLAGGGCGGGGAQRWRVAPGRGGKPDESLGVERVGVAGWVGKGVGEPVVHRGHAGRVGVAEVGNLDRGEALRKKGDAVEASVAGEVEKDVGSIVAQKGGNGVVGRGGDVAPFVGEGAEALGHGIDFGVVVIENHLECGAVEVREKRFEKIGDGVCAEIGGEDDESQARAGGGACGDLGRQAGLWQGGSHALTGLHVLGKKLLPRDVREVVQPEEPGALRIVLAGVAVDCPAIGGKGFREAVTAFEGEALPCVGVGESGFEGERTLEASECFAELADIA